jgi:excisionase family DNA binding protein
MLLTVAEAASRLGVGEPEVRRLARSGALSANRFGRTLMFDPDHVETRARMPIQAGRTWAARTAWAALWELSGERANWLDASTRSRLRARLRLYTAEQLLAAVRERAVRHDLALTRIEKNHHGIAYLVLSGWAVAGRAGAYVPGYVPGYGPTETYCLASKLETALDRFVYPRPDQSPSTMKLIVRVPRFDGLPLGGRAHMPAAVIAVDLAESRDARAQQAGLRVLTDALVAQRR